jgi:hypothetical protein
MTRDDERLQFGVLYREFLFRMIDLDVLAAHAQGDSNRLLGQFAGLLIFFSSTLALGAILFDAGLDTSRMTLEAIITAVWTFEHFLIATTMLVVGILAVLSWDSTFPNRRDVLVLLPLPLRLRTMFLAKVAALGAAFALAVGSFHLAIGVFWPMALAMPKAHGFLDLFVSLGLYRAVGSYWITMLAAGAFLFCSVLTVQGLAAQLCSRGLFLRVSALLQIAALCLFVSVYFLQPSLASPRALFAPQNQHLLAWLPSYWFLALFQQLNGPSVPLLAPLARRAGIGLAAAIFGAGITFLLAYFRTLRKIVEEPDILPGTRRARWLPPFGKSVPTAMAHFSIRTLLRSRQHRVILAFYLGIGFAITVLVLKTPPPPQQLLGSDPWHHAGVPLLVSNVVILCLAALGVRAVFGLPLELRANWAFRIMPLRGAPPCLAAARRALLVLAVAPVWCASAALFLTIWPWREAIGHMAVLGLLGFTVAEACLFGFQKIPFTCSYLPGKSRIHLKFLLYLGIFIFITNTATEFEMQALHDPVRYGLMLAVLTAALLALRWRNENDANSEEAALRFEETESPAVFVLDLHRDGVTPL